jgi:hypothetical protein
LRTWLWVSPWNSHLIKDDKVQPREFNDIKKMTWNWTILHGMKTLLKVESCGLRGTQLPEKDKWKFDVLSEKVCRRKLAQTKNVGRKVLDGKATTTAKNALKNLIRNLSGMLLSIVWIQCCKYSLQKSRVTNYFLSNFCTNELPVPPK